MVPADQERAISAGALLKERYRVESVIARGHATLVVLATHVHLDERVVVKICRRAWPADVQVVARARREARAAFRIQSPHVARVLDVDILDEGLPFIVMEYLEGVDLKRLLAHRGPLPVEEAIGYVAQAGEALIEAHGHGIVHRDLKPSNLFVTRRPDGGPVIKVLDFGVSKMMGSLADAEADVPRDEDGAQQLMGSPRYMSPEQIHNPHLVDHRTDIWALGVILHELLAGSPLFGAKTKTDALKLVLTKDPVPISSLRSDVPSAVERAVLRCLQYAPEQRFPTVQELMTVLAPFAPIWAKARATLSVPEIRSSSPLVVSIASPEAGDGLSDGRASPPEQKRRRVAVWIGAACVLGISGLAWWLRQSSHSTDNHSRDHVAAQTVQAPRPAAIDPGGPSTSPSALASSRSGADRGLPRNGDGLAWPASSTPDDEQGTLPMRPARPRRRLPGGSPSHRAGDKPDAPPLAAAPEKKQVPVTQSEEEGDPLEGRK